MKEIAVDELHVRLFQSYVKSFNIYCLECQFCDKTKDFLLLSDSLLEHNEHCLNRIIDRNLDVS